MGQLVYTSIGSLDGYVADVDGGFDWAAPDEEVHAFVNERDRAVSLELYGRRLYDVMRVWETYGTEPAVSRSSASTARSGAVGTRWLPDGLRLELRLTGTHRFACGVVHLEYAVVA